MTSSITYGMVTLTIDNVTPFSQPLDVQNVCKNTCFSLNKSCRNSDSLFKMAESLRTMKDSFIFFNLFCVLESK